MDKTVSVKSQEMLKGTSDQRDKLVVRTKGERQGLPMGEKSAVDCQEEKSEGNTEFRISFLKVEKMHLAAKRR